jgi:hypothetical protein
MVGNLIFTLSTLQLNDLTHLHSLDYIICTIACLVTSLTILYNICAQLFSLWDSCSIPWNSESMKEKWGTDFPINVCEKTYLVLAINKNTVCD